MGVIGLCLCGKRKLRSLFWRVRAEIRRQVKGRTSKQKFSFHYDPFSYALNFDNAPQLHCTTINAPAPALMSHPFVLSCNITPFYFAIE
ncbi:hypothetical protein Gorai_009603 [Gossypium raimondii]|uniref:Uncharacterized protein n=1 Tax=Gossypium raimondii TaxID=29730 RepID=A0A7J8PTV8_GOSRA|nr:hypothetical protein [Gossypium raimondii]